MRAAQRKVLYSCFKKKLDKDIKVVQLAGVTSASFADPNYGLMMYPLRLGTQVMFRSRRVTIMETLPSTTPSFTWRR